jgi:uncharacterized protein YkwD
MADVVVRALQDARVAAGRDPLNRRTDLDDVAMARARSIGMRPTEARNMERPVEHFLREAGIEDFLAARIHIDMKRGQPDKATAFVSSWHGYEQAWSAATSTAYDAIGIAAHDTPDGWTILVGILIDEGDPSFRTRASADRAAQFDLEAMELGLLRRVNDMRAEHGLGSLALDPPLSRVARAHSADMAGRGYFGHWSPERHGPQDRARAGGVSYRKLGENVQMSRGHGDPVETAVQSWIASPGHRKTMLTPEFTATGVGVARDARGTFYFTQLYVVPAK